MLDCGVFKVLWCEKWAIWDPCYCCAPIRKNKFNHKITEKGEIFGQILAVLISVLSGRQRVVRNQIPVLLISRISSWCQYKFKLSDYFDLIPLCNLLIILWFLMLHGHNNNNNKSNNNNNNTLDEGLKFPVSLAFSILIAR